MIELPAENALAHAASTVADASALSSAPGADGSSRHRRAAGGVEYPWNIEEQLNLAGQVQRALLPEPLQHTDPLQISALYLPADRVSGDLYDVVRLDETRIGVSLVDVTGHGLPAALLTFLIRKSLRGKEILDRSYRLIEPDELLARMNSDLLNARLSPCHFITGLHAIFDRTSAEIRWARGGCPYPILIRHGQPACLMSSEGGLIGAFPQSFQTVRLHLGPGDVLVFYTDGVEALLLDRPEQPQTHILQTEWVRLLESAGPTMALAHLEELARASVEADWPIDDITILTLHMA